MPSGVLKELKLLPKASCFKVTDLKSYKRNQCLQRKKVKRSSCYNPLEVRKQDFLGIWLISSQLKDED